MPNPSAIPRSARERRALAMKPTTPPQVLVELANLAVPDVTSSVAMNPSAPVELLVALSANESYLVRTMVAGNLSTPVEVLEKLALDPSDEVRVNARALLKVRAPESPALKQRYRPAKSR